MDIFRTFVVYDMSVSVMDNYCICKEIQAFHIPIGRGARGSQPL